MPNQLTGKYDAVVEVRVDAVNRILAILHQREANADASPSFQHSFAIRIDYAGAEIKKAVVSKYGDWVSAIPWTWGRTEKVPRSADKAPPGVSQTLSELNEMVAELKDELVTPEAPRGTAQVQLSTPTIEIPHGSTSEMVASVQLRVNYIPDPDTVRLPEPIHGELRLRFFVNVKTLGDKTVLEEKLTGSNNEIQFVSAPGTGLSVQDTALIESEIRRVLKAGLLDSAGLELPQDFPFKQFKGLGSGSDHVVALPLHQSEPEPPPSAFARFNNVFLTSGYEDFAIAVGKDYILSFIQPSLDELKAPPHPTFTVTATLGLWPLTFTVTTTYTVTFDVAEATWTNGKIRIYVQGKAETPAWWAPNVGFKIEQNITFQFTPGTQDLKVVPVGQPAVDVNASGPLGGWVKTLAAPKVRKEFEVEREKALAAANSQIEQVLKGEGSPKNALKSLYPARDYLQYTSLDVDPNDGLILRGQLTARTPAPVVVQFNERGEGSGFSALQSWIPGGTIERFVWTWVIGGSKNMPWQQKTGTHTDEHRFVLRFAPDRTDEPVPTGAHQMCLRVVGNQVVGGVHQVSEADGGGCQVSSGPLRFEMPYWWGRINTPVWLPDPPPDLVMDNAIVAHVNTLAHSRDTTAPGTNTIIYFADAKWERPLETLGGTLLQMARREAPIAVILILPRGSFGEPRSSFEKRLGSLGSDFTGLFEVTEDYEGEWRRMFGVERTPATYLMNARGEYVWHQVGPLDAAAFKAALDEHLISGSQPRSRVLRLAVGPGDEAFNVLSDNQRRWLLLRGQRVLLVFWKSWSTPCIRELRRLQRLHDQADQQGAVILAINDGEDSRRIAEIRREHEFTFKLVADRHRRICQRYRVHCWPTTVSIDEEGFVDRVHFGMTHDRSSGTRTDRGTSDGNQI